MRKLALLLLVLTINTSAVRWSVPTYIINSEHNDYKQVAAYTPNDQLFVVWSSIWGTVYYDVSFAQVNEVGELTIPPTRIYEEDGIYDAYITVAVDSLGHAHIFWRRSASGSHDIWYTQVDTADGSYLVNRKLLITAQPHTDLFMYAVCDSDNNAHLLYCGAQYDAVEDDWWDACQYAKVDPGGNLLFSDKLVSMDISYEQVYFDKGIAVDSDGDAHFALVFQEPSNPDYDRTIGYRKMSGIDGSPLTTIIDVGNPSTNSPLSVPAYFSDQRPSITIDSNDDIHITYIHQGDGEHSTAYVKLDNDGVILRSPYIAYFDPDNGYGESNMLITHDDRIFVIGNRSGDGVCILELNTSGDLVDTHHCLKSFGCHSQVGPTGCIGPSGYLRVVGHDRISSFDYDVIYVHQVDDSWVFSPLLAARSTEEGLLLSWRSGKPDSTWRLTRNDEQLVSLSGRSDYAYLDYSLEPNTTYSFSLEAELADGEVQSFGPIEAAWQPPSADRLSLETPYPCPAGDSVTLSYSLPQDTTVAELAIYDLSGRLVDLFPLAPTSGQQTLSVNTTAYRSGVYLATLQTTAETITQRLVIAR